MKIRTDFVSNSSSCSFIVGFYKEDLKKIKSIKDLRTFMYGNKNYIEHEGKKLSTVTAAEIIYNKIKFGPEPESKIILAIETSNELHRFIDFEDMNVGDDEKLDNYYKERKRLAKIFWKNVKDDYEPIKYYVFQFWDNLCQKTSDVMSSGKEFDHTKVELIELN
ncbi:hypothetical protein M0R19_08465 [Candidatus Pacearchaeota archaeon]|jgi:hypothetical protein|nr:hypothetical protein [bacterium]MCK9597190.1 hypothetical protein [Candidatus Pacearchaeota archaeon]